MQINQYGEWIYQTFLTIFAHISFIHSESQDDANLLLEILYAYSKIFIDPRPIGLLSFMYSANLLDNL